MVKLGAVLLVKMNGAEECLSAHLRFAPEGWWNRPLVVKPCSLLKPVVHKIPLLKIICWLLRANLLFPPRSVTWGKTSDLARLPLLGLRMKTGACGIVIWSPVHFVSLLVPRFVHLSLCHFVIVHLLCLVCLDIIKKNSTQAAEKQKQYSI